MPVTAANVQRFTFSTPQLPDGELEVVSFVGREAISQPFHFELELISENPSVPFSDVIDQQATLGMTWEGGLLPVHGVVAHFEQGGPMGDYYSYRAVLVPRLWRLSLTHQSRIFQQLSVPDIVKQVLQGSGFAPDDFEFQLAGSYVEREYCTQYQETDLAFVSRLLEHEGICYYFKHEDTREVLVLTDDRSHYPPIGGNDKVTCRPTGGMAAPDEETVQAFVFHEQIVTGKVVLKDYNYQTPGADLRVESQISDELPGVYYEYGPNYKDAGEGGRLARVRNEEIECRRRVGRGEGGCLRLRAGHVFTLDAHYRLDLNHGYLVTEVSHYGSQRGGMTMQVGGEDATVPYRNEFTCIPSTVPYRPPRRTPQPRLPGLMTAKMETAGGDYAHLDDQGRYHAKMDFDLGDAGDGTASLPIPMKQAYSGPDYGIHFPNHAATDMLWACINGDPDRPLALGTTPNPDQASPSTNANKHQNVIRTWGQNELTFDDKQGEENIYLFATKDHTVEVTNDEMITIANDQGETVGHDQSLGVANNRDKTVGVDQSEVIGRNKTIGVGGFHEETIGGSMTQSVGGAKSESIGTAKTLTIAAAYQVSVGGVMNETVGGAKTEEVGAFKGEAVGGNKSETIGGNKSTTTGGDVSITVGKDMVLSVAKDRGEKVGGKQTVQVAQEYAVNAKKIQFMAEDEIVLKTGSAEIKMKKNGDIVIKGKKIQVTGSGDVIIKGSKVKQN